MARAKRGRGEGGVEQLPSGKWRAILCRTEKATGKRTRMSKTFRTKPEAVQWLAEQRSLGTPVVVGTVGEWLTRWLESHKRRVAPKTYSTDKWAVDKYLTPGLGLVKLRDLDAEGIEKHIDSLPCSANEKHKAARTLRNALFAAVRAKTLAQSPMGGKKVVLPKRKVKPTGSLDETQLARLIEYADTTRHGPLIRLWVDAGLRPSELLGLKWSDLDLEAGTVRIERAVCPTTNQLKEPKTTKSRRVLPLASSTVAALKALTQGQPEEPLTTGAGGHWWLSNFARNVFRPLVKKAGVKCTPYMLRHTCATLLLRAGVSLKVVSERLGHEDVTMTLRTYQHCLPDEQHRAAKAWDGLLPTFSPRPAKKQYTREDSNL